MCFGKAVICAWRKLGLTNFAEDLSFRSAIVPSEIIDRSLAHRTCAIRWDITYNTTEYRFDSFSIAFLVVKNQIFPSPVLLVGNDLRKYINLELLIFR